MSPAAAISAPRRLAAAAGAAPSSSSSSAMSTHAVHPRPCLRRLITEAITEPAAASCARSYEPRPCGQTYAGGRMGKAVASLAAVLAGLVLAGCGGGGAEPGAP